MLFFICCLCMQQPPLKAATRNICKGKESTVVQVHVMLLLPLPNTQELQRTNSKSRRSQTQDKENNNFLPHPQKHSFCNPSIILLKKMGKIQLVREQRNQNTTLAAPFQLHVSWVMKETFSSLGKKK